MTIESAHEHAIDRALQHACELVPMVRRQVDQKTVIRETAREGPCNQRRQSTARAVASRPPDPQLHSHVLIHEAPRSHPVSARTGTSANGRQVAIRSVGLMWA